MGSDAAQQQLLLLCCRLDGLFGGWQPSNRCGIDTQHQPLGAHVWILDFENLTARQKSFRAMCLPFAAIRPSTARFTRAAVSSRI